MVDIKRQAANFTVDGLYVVSDIFARIDTVILFEGAVKGVIIRKTAVGRDGRNRLFFHEQPFGFQQPLLDDILVKTDLHILLEHVGKLYLSMKSAFATVSSERSPLRFRSI